MKILVTGGSGFLGSHLCEKLLVLGHDVTAVDDFSTSSPSNVEALLANPRFELIEHDVTVALELEVDGIFNFACPASPVQYQRSPTRTIRTSFMGALNMLELARRSGARILQASTSEIYGDPLVSPQDESYWGNVNPIGPRACYDEGKRAAETLFFDYFREFATDIRVARIFNTYGPKMAADDGRVVSSFVVQALAGAPITIFGDGTHTRSFCFVDDLVDGLVRLFFADGIHEPVNLGNPEPITVNELADEILQLTGSRSAVLHSAIPVDDPLHREPDISRARRLLGWNPVVSRREGLQATIDYFRGDSARSHEV